MLRTFLNLCSICSILILASCQKDNSAEDLVIGTTITTNDTTSSTISSNDTMPIEPFMNKWWYSSPRYISDLYFKSNGVFHHSIPSQPNYSSARWSWIDEKNGIIRIDDWVHQISNDTNTVFIKTIRLTSKRMYIQQSIHSSTIFNGSMYLYLDTK